MGTQIWVDLEVVMTVSDTIVCGLRKELELTVLKGRDREDK